MSRPSRRRRLVAWLLLVSIVIPAGACAGGGAATDPTGTTGLPAVASPAIGPSAAATGTDGAGPPDATLAVDGGDPVRGQLGTYTWFETGSDSPWLPGAPMTVGAGEPLRVELVPAGAIASWQARYVPAAQDSADGAVALVEGPGATEFAAPPVGRWTVELQVEFPAGQGSASYYWRLEVR